MLCLYNLPIQFRLASPLLLVILAALNMSVSEIFVLVGQVVQILASFILSANVIGLDRLAKWSKSLKAFKLELLKKNDKQSRFKRGRALAEYSLCLVVGTLTVLLMRLLMARFYSEVGQLVRIWPLAVGVLFTLVSLGLLWCLYRLLIAALSLAVTGLQTLENRTRKHASGVLGFLLLFIGFVLQFGGTLAQALLTSAISD